MDVHICLLIKLIILFVQVPSDLAEIFCSRQLGIGHQTAWTVRCEIMDTMTRRQGELMLAGIVEMDESYVGGVNKGFRGKGAKGKTPVAVMCEQNESGGCCLAHMQVIENIGGMSMRETAASYIALRKLTGHGWICFRSAACRFRL